MKTPRELKAEWDRHAAPWNAEAANEAHAPGDARAARRVLARVTEEDEQTYGYRCERCRFAGDGPSLSIAADIARTHAVATGHAVLVEAL